MCIVVKMCYWCLFCMVDYHNYFTTVHLLMKTGVAYWLRQQLRKCALQAQHNGRILHAKYVNYVLYAHPPLQWVSKMHRPWAYNTYSTVVVIICSPPSFYIELWCKNGGGGGGGCIIHVMVVMNIANSLWPFQSKATIYQSTLISAVFHSYKYLSKSTVL